MPRHFLAHRLPSNALSHETITYQNKGSTQIHVYVDLGSWAFTAHSFIHPEVNKG